MDFNYLREHMKIYQQIQRFHVNTCVFLYLNSDRKNLEEEEALSQLKNAGCTVKSVWKWPPCRNVETFKGFWNWNHTHLCTPSPLTSLLPTPTLLYGKISYMMKAENRTISFASLEHLPYVSTDTNWQGKWQ